MKELFETESRRRVFDELLAELGCSDIGAMVPAMIDCYRSHSPRIELLPDARRALDRWCPHFYTALISDGPLGMQERKVVALGLSERLSLIILTDRWGPEYWKPRPRAFQLAEQASGQSGAACVYIADNAAKDFLAPNLRGWRTIHIRRPVAIYSDAVPPEGGCPEFQVDSLDEVDISF